MLRPAFLRHIGRPNAKLRILLGVCFCLLSYLGNAINIDMFFGINFLYGSVFVWLVMITLGHLWAIAAAFIGALYTVELWGHWCAVIVFTSEAIFVTALCKHTTTHRLTIMVVAFWLGIGGPLALVLYTQILDIPWATSVSVATKQALNGILNAIVASLIATSALYFYPKGTNANGFKDENSYSGLLQQTFGLALLLPVLMSEYVGLQRNFQRNIALELELSEFDVRNASRNFASFLRLETMFWGTEIAKLDLTENTEKIQKLVEKDVSAAPSHIYAVMDDGTFQLLYGKASSWRQLAEPERAFQEALNQNMGLLIGCHEGQFTSLYTQGSNADSFAFIWPIDAIRSISYHQQTDETVFKCFSGQAGNLNRNFDTTSAIVLRDTDPSIARLQSWLDAKLVAQAAFAAQNPVILEISHPLRSTVLQIQLDTSNALQRLLFLAMLIVLGGAALDFLFRMWMEKFARTSEAYLEHGQAPPNSLNLNFMEDRQISQSLHRLSRAVENEEKSKRRAQRNFTTLLRKASTPIFATNAEGLIKIWNPAIQDLTGFSSDEVLGKPISDFLEGETDPTFAHGGGNASDLLFDVPTRGGGSVHLVVSRLRIDTNEEANPISSEKKVPPVGNTSYFIAQNLSELKESQAKLIHASRLAALGEMASSFAHELNQPLNVIILSAGSLLEHAKTGEVSLEYLISKAARVEEQAMRAGKVIRGIRRFTLEIEGEEIINFDPVDESKEAFGLIEEQLRLENITVNFHAPSTPIRIKGNPILFEQAMVNLLVNAKQAMEKQALSERQVAITFADDGDKVTILMQDSGPGIPKNIMGRVFDPFFSTKKDVGGTGIGLYMSRTVIEALHGTIRAVDVDHGACFEIKLPTASDPLGG